MRTSTNSSVVKKVAKVLSDVNGTGKLTQYDKSMLFYLISTGEFKVPANTY